MTKNKLMDVFDGSYRETFNQILNKIVDREEAKELLGLIYRETWDGITKATNTIENIKLAFEQAKIRHGIFTVPAFAHVKN